MDAVYDLADTAAVESWRSEMTDSALVVVVVFSVLVVMGLHTALAVAFPTREDLAAFLRKLHILPPRF
jgi:hypothetical protein